MSQSANILESWKANAANWIATIDNQEIESRKLVTNTAIIDTIKSYSLKRMIDIGCGEGWLTRALLQAGIEAVGVDAVEDLVKNAISKGGPQYFVGSYADIVSGKVLEPHAYDSAVINFALLDKEESEKLIHYLSGLLIPKGLLFIQTLHPFSIAAADSYVSEWKEGSWDGLKQPFVLPYQWYFRTLQDWCQLFTSAGFIIEEIREPVHPQTLKPLSLLFVLKAL